MLTSSIMEIKFITETQTTSIACNDQHSVTKMLKIGEEEEGPGHHTREGRGRSQVTCRGRGDVIPKQRTKVKLNHLSQLYIISQAGSLRR